MRLLGNTLKSKRSPFDDYRGSEQMALSNGFHSPAFDSVCLNLEESVNCPSSLVFLVTTEPKTVGVTSGLVPDVRHLGFSDVFRHRALTA